MPIPTTRRRVGKGAKIIVALAILVEATSNALKAYVLGSHFEGLTVVLTEDTTVSAAGVILVCAAIVVSFTQARTAWVAWSPGDPTHRMFAGVVAVLCVSISISAMSAHILDMQRSKSGAETQDATAYRDAKALYDAKAADYERVKASPSLAQVDAAFNEAVQSSGIDRNIYDRTAKCTTPKTKAEKRECNERLPPSFASKRAAAELKEQLAAELPKLKADVERHKLKDTASTAEASFNRLWAWLFGVAIVVIATTGGVVFADSEETHPEIPEAPAMPRYFPANDFRIPGIPPPTPPNGGGRRGRKSDSTVANFAAEFRERHGRYPSGSDIRAEFPDLPQSTAYDYASRARRHA